MKTCSWLLFALVGAAVFGGCSESRPSNTVAEQALRQEVESQSQGEIKLVSFTKTDGQNFELNGIHGYNMDFEAIIEFNEAGRWLSGGFGPDRLGYEFSTAPALRGALGGFLNQAIEGGMSVIRGTRVKIVGTMTGAKKESGWVFQSLKSQITGVLSQGSAPSFQTPAQMEAICINNLRQIDVSKQRWALEHFKNLNDVPTEADLASYFPSRRFPQCPVGGAYSINRVGDKPTCSIAEHVLP